ncbi:MAG TPA: hypothetical protein DEB09_00065 [Candidatus Magasanikbacteria bacterium]|nr:hypothetical protein [Candidatus Magasanikbacteria bacterium]
MPQAHRGSHLPTRVASSAVEAEALPPVGRVGDVGFENLVHLLGGDRDRILAQITVHEELERDQIFSDESGDDGDAFRV